MKHLKLGTLLLVAALFIGFGATTLSAESMKCGAGKCGNAKSVMKPGCDCNSKKSATSQCDCKDECNCGTKALPEAKGAMKCGTGKCGSK